MCISACCICVCVCAYSIDSPLHQCINHFVHRFFPRSFAHYVFFLISEICVILSFLHGSIEVCCICQFVCVCVCARVRVYVRSFIRQVHNRALGFLKLWPAKRARSPNSSSILQLRKQMKRSKVIHSFFNFYFFMKTTHFGDRFP